jgi:hypothetical protein
MLQQIHFSAGGKGQRVFGSCGNFAHICGGNYFFDGK